MPGATSRRSWTPPHPNGVVRRSRARSDVQCWSHLGCKRSVFRLVVREANSFPSLGSRVRISSAAFASWSRIWLYGRGFAGVGSSSARGQARGVCGQNGHDLRPPCGHGIRAAASLAALAPVATPSAAHWECPNAIQLPGRGGPEENCVGGEWPRSPTEHRRGEQLRGERRSRSVSHSHRREPMPP